MGEIHNHLCEIHQIGADTRERIVGQDLCKALGSHRILLTGISDAASGFEWVRLAPKIAQLLVCVGGRGEVWHRDRWKSLSEEMAYLTFSGKMHAYRAVKGSRWQVCWVMFDARSAGGALSESREPEVVRTDPRPLYDAIAGLHREFGSAREAACERLWADLVDVYARRIVSGLQQRLWKLWDGVNRDLAADWSLDSLAKASGMGPEHLRRLCKSETGRSPLKHVTYLRMQHAAALLATDQKIGAIASAVGYDNPYAFSTAFKRCFGLEPSRFRERKTGPRAA